MANPNFNCVLDAWRSGTTLYGRMHYWRSGSYYYQDTSFPNPTMDLGGGAVFSDSTLGNAVRNGVYVGDIYGATFSRTVSGTGSRTITYTAGSGQRSDFAGSWSATVGGFPGTSSPPTGLSCSNIVRGQNSFTATVSLGSWGVNNTGSGSRYRELQCWTIGMVEPRRYQVQYGDSLSGTITVSNSSSGSLNIMPNTMYRLGVYATNGAQTTGSQSVGDYTTLPPTPTITNTDVTTTSATFSYDVPNQGGKYTMTLKKQLDSGALETVTTLSGSGQKTGTFTVTGLSPGETHTLSVTISTDAGSVSSNSVTFTTAVPTAKVYGSISGDTKLIKKLYGSVNDQTKEIKKVYGSVNGQTKLIY